MQYAVYILYSVSRDRYYIGHTNDLKNRIIHHNSGRTPSTRSGTPWTLKYTEPFATKGEAMKREYEIKGKKRRAYIEALIRSAG